MKNKKNPSFAYDTLKNKIHTLQIIENDINI